MKQENNTGIIIGITAAAVAFLAIIIAGLIFVLPFFKEKCTDFFVEKKLEEGYEYLSQQDYEPAIAAFNKVVKVDDQRTEAYIGLADAYSGQKNWVPAANYYSTAIDNIQNGVGTIQNDSFTDKYLMASGRSPEHNKSTESGLTTSSMNKSTGNTVTVADQDLLQVLVDKRNNAIDCGKEKNNSAQDDSMKTAESSVEVEGPDTDDNSSSGDIPAQDGFDPSDSISTADNISPSDEIPTDEETQTVDNTDPDDAMQTDDDEDAIEDKTNEEVDEGAIENEPSPANDPDQADENNDEELNDSADEQTDDNADDSSDEQTDDNADDSADEQTDDNADDSADEQPDTNNNDYTDESSDDDSEDELIDNDQNALKPYAEVIDKLKEEYGEIRMTKSIQDPDNAEFAELNGVCLLTLLDMDGMGEKELFAVCKNDKDTSYKGIIYTIKDNKAVAALENADTAASLYGYDSTVCIHRSNNRDYILVAESEEDGSYSISGYIGDKFATVEYSYEKSYVPEDDEEEEIDTEEEESTSDDEDSYNDEESEDWDDSGEEDYNNEESESWDDSGDEDYNDEESESWDDSGDEDYNDEESEDWTESEDVKTCDDEDTYDVSYKGSKSYFINCTCRVDPNTHKVINCASTDGSESASYDYYINDQPVDEDVFTNGLAGFGLSLDGSQGEDTQYILAGYKKDIRLEALKDLISTTETEIYEGLKMS